MDGPGFFGGLPMRVASFSKFKGKPQVNYSDAVAQLGKNRDAGEQSNSVH